MADDMVERKDNATESTDVMLRDVTDVSLRDVSDDVTDGVRITEAAAVLGGSSIGTDDTALVVDEMTEKIRERKLRKDSDSGLKNDTKTTNISDKESRTHIISEVSKELKSDPESDSLEVTLEITKTSVDERRIMDKKLNDHPHIEVDDNSLPTKSSEIVNKTAKYSNEDSGIFTDKNQSEDTIVDKNENVDTEMTDENSGTDTNEVVNYFGMVKPSGNDTCTIEGSKTEKTGINSDAPEISAREDPIVIDVEIGGSEESPILIPESENSQKPPIASRTVIPGITSLVADYRSDGSDSLDSDSDTSSASTSSCEFMRPVQRVRPRRNSEEERALKEKPVTRGELLIDDLPPIEDLCITVDKETPLLPLGKVTSIVGNLVVVQSEPNTAALDMDSIIFTEDRKSLGQIFETFGPVKSPFYSIRFNTVSQIQEKGVGVGMMLYCAPSMPDYTHFVFVNDIRKMKGSDASWANNNEPPEQCLEYSDDEQERFAKKERGRLSKLAKGATSWPPEDEDSPDSCVSVERTDRAPKRFKTRTPQMDRPMRPRMENSQNVRRNDSGPRFRPNKDGPRLRPNNDGPRFRPRTPQPRFGAPPMFGGMGPPMMAPAYGMPTVVQPTGLAVAQQWAPSGVPQQWAPSGAPPRGAPFGAPPQRAPFGGIPMHGAPFGGAPQQRAPFGVPHPGWGSAPLQQQPQRSPWSQPAERHPNPTSQPRPMAGTQPISAAQPIWPPGTAPPTRAPNSGIQSLSAAQPTWPRSTAPQTATPRAPTVYSSQSEYWAQYGH